jgi:hypothetical protein
MQSTYAHVYWCLHAGNDGDIPGRISGTGTVKDPNTAKNSLSVAATTNWDWTGPGTLLNEDGSRVGAYVSNLISSKFYIFSSAL